MIETERVFMGKSSEPRSNSNTPVNDSFLGDDTRTSKMAVTSEGNDDDSITAWVCLDSCAADSDVPSKTMHEKGITGEALSSQDIELSRPSRCCKKSRSRGQAVAEDRHTIDTVQQLHLGPVVFATTPRKPRKRSTESRSSLNIGLTVESSCHVDNCRDD